MTRNAKHRADAEHPADVVETDEIAAQEALASEPQEGWPFVLPEGHPSEPRGQLP